MCSKTVEGFLFWVVRLKPSNPTVDLKHQWIKPKTHFDKTNCIGTKCFFSEKIIIQKPKSCAASECFSASWQELQWFFLDWCGGHGKTLIVSCCGQSMSGGSSRLQVSHCVFCEKVGTKNRQMSNSLGWNWNNEKHLNKWNSHQKPDVTDPSKHSPHPWMSWGHSSTSWRFSNEQLKQCSQDDCQQNFLEPHSASKRH